MGPGRTAGIMTVHHYTGNGKAVVSPCMDGCRLRRRGWEGLPAVWQDE